MSKCQSLATPTPAIASSLKTIQSHNPAIKTNSTTNQVVGVPNATDRVPLTGGTTFLLTALAGRRGLFTLLCLTRIGHGSYLVLRHSDKLTTWLFMTNDFQLRHKKARPTKDADR